MAKSLIGTVRSAKMEKTVVVSVERAYRHPLYKKTIKRHKKYLVDTNDMEVREGDRVKILETRPISAHKRFKVVEKLS